MEFFYIPGRIDNSVIHDTVRQPSNDTWTRQSNSENKFALHVMGQTIPISNFYESLAKHFPDVKVHDVKFDGFMPYVDNTETQIYCNILVNFWHPGRDYGHCLNFLYQSIATIQSAHIAKLQKLSMEQHKRIDKLEALFDTIRQGVLLLMNSLKLATMLLKSVQIKWRSE